MMVIINSYTDALYMTWEESVKRDLKDWSIDKELAMDRGAWKLSIHVPEP